MKLLNEILQKRGIFYVARDIERAWAGVQLPGIFIISNLTEYSKKVATGQGNVLLLDEGHILDTWELLEHPHTHKFIFEHAVGKPQALVFKNTSQIERICEEKGITLLNPPAALSARIEEKISQVEWLDELAKYLPPHKIEAAQNITFTGTPFILQFNRAHTGLGTILIESAEQLREIQEKFPHRPVRVSEFVDGPMLTSNNIVCADKILVGNVSYQITGLEPFTENRFTTIGNDWALPFALLDDELRAQYNKMVEDIGVKLRVDGWKGLFGVDIVLDETARKLYLIEINARQPASTTFESQLQMIGDGKTGITTFEAHLASLLDVDCSNEKLTELREGSQIIQRVTQPVLEKNLNQNAIIEQLESLQLFNIIPYPNTELGSDWLRLQLYTGIIEAPGVLNEIGLKIKNILSNNGI